MQTKRFTSKGAEKWLGKEIKCLNHGFVRLVDYMGGDDSVVQAARVSYGRGTKKREQDEGLIRYLLRHDHTTPFEMVEYKFHCKMPIFVARQWVRHRTANINEYSGRYSKMLNEFYIPEDDQLRLQSTTNMQGRGRELDSENKDKAKRIFNIITNKGFEAYDKLLQKNLSRELSRMVLPISNYTQWYWKIDLHNLFRFVRLRSDSHAQYEIQVYAKAIAKILQDSVPFCWKAFEDYQIKSERLSRFEKLVIKEFSNPIKEKHLDKFLAKIGLKNQREISELKEKLKDLKILK